MTHPGVYCLRSNETSWDEATLWRTYFMLTDVEAVFRSLQSEPGLRPIHHPKPLRTEGHLSISVFAHHLVEVIRIRLRQAEEHASWATLRGVLEGQQRITGTPRRAEGRTWHVRKPSEPEPLSRLSTTPWASAPMPGASTRPFHLIAHLGKWTEL